VKRWLSQVVCVKNSFNKKLTERETHMPYVTAGKEKGLLAFIKV